VGLDCRIGGLDSPFEALHLRLQARHALLERQLRLALLLLGQQMAVALLLLARAASDSGDQIAPGQAFDRLPQFVVPVESVKPLGPRAQLARRLGPAEHQHGQDRDLRGVEAERLVKQVPVLRRAAACAAGEPDPAPARQPLERLADGAFVELDDGIAVRRLVAGESKRVEAERVLVRGGALLLDQRTQHADLLGSQIHPRDSSPVVENPLMTELSVRGRAEAAIARALLGLPESLVQRLAGSPIEVDGQRMAPDAQLLLRLRNLAPNAPYEEMPVAEVRDVEVAGLSARLYVPEVEHGGLLVYYHGGGWVLGSLDSHEQPCRFLAREGAVRVLSVDYRLAPEAKFPAAVEDGLAAFAWAREHAAELGTEPDRIGVGGDSAGGNISAVVAQLAEPKPALALLIYPVCDLSKKYESYRLFGEGFFLTERNMDWYRTNYLPDEQSGRDPRASPLLADDLSGMPPTYVLVAGFDALRDEGLAYARRLEDAGVDVELAFHPGLFHGCANATGV